MVVKVSESCHFGFPLWTLILCPAANLRSHPITSSEVFYQGWSSDCSPELSTGPWNPGNFRKSSPRFSCEHGSQSPSLCLEEQVGKLLLFFPKKNLDQTVFFPISVENFLLLFLAFGEKLTTQNLRNSSFRLPQTKMFSFFRVWVC